MDAALIKNCQKLYTKIAALPFAEAKKEIDKMEMWLVTALMIGSMTAVSKNGGTVIQNGKIIKV